MLKSSRDNNANPITTTPAAKDISPKLVNPACAAFGVGIPLAMAKYTAAPVIHMNIPAVIGKSPNRNKASPFPPRTFSERELNPNNITNIAATSNRPENSAIPTDPAASICTATWFPTISKSPNTPGVNW